MKKAFVVTAVVGLALLGTAAWATLPQVDPATVPIGNLVANNRVSTPLRRRLTPFGWLEPVEADDRTG